MKLPEFLIKNPKIFLFLLSMFVNWFERFLVDRINFSAPLDRFKIKGLFTKFFHFIFGVWF
ncbi:hypothetical protein C462_10762 [Halorubrum distributum JCM 13916]|uniref:Uncharacterized protein n=1 Tax=Halorubrum distributum JCM 13916 TaxID=1230455 RepID=M0PJW2_9EURY|nr:hypothetical protein C462_10762 [Halorubrum arcis JCM 13916]